MYRKVGRKSQRTSHRSFMEPRGEQTSCKGPGSKYVQVCHSEGFCHNLNGLSYRQHVNEWVCLGANKALFTQTGRGPDLAQGS